MLELEYMKVYDFESSTQKCKGIYLGESNLELSFPRKILLKAPGTKRCKEGFHIRMFKDFKLNGNVLNLGRNYPVKIPLYQKSYYRDLLEEKIKQ